MPKYYQSMQATYKMIVHRVDIRTIKILIYTALSTNCSISSGNAAIIAESARGEYCNWDYLSVSYT